MAYDKELMAAYQDKLDQTKRNVEQGEMGRSLAMGKILDMKTSFQTLSQNIVDETQIIRDEVAQDQEKKKINPEKQVQEVAALEKTSKSVLADISTVAELQTTILTTGTDGEVIQKDQDLADDVTKIQAAIKDTSSFVNEYKSTENKKQQEALAQQEAGDNDPLHTKKRSQAEKDEMAAFLSGN